MSGGKYVDAGFILKDLNYKDSAEKYAECMDKAAYEMTNIGDIIKVKVLEIDDKGRLNLSRRDALIDLDGAVPENTLSEKPRRERSERPRNDRPRRDRR